MRILIGCERSGTVRDEFRKLGHDAWSCDLEPDDKGSKYHIQGDVLDVIDEYWNIGIFHPPCTYLTVTGNKWMNPEFETRFPTRQQDRQDAIDFFMRLARCKIKRKALENPVGIISTVWRKPDQIVQPYWFGDPHSKQTCLWLENLPLLTPTKMVEPQFHIYQDGRRDPIWHYETMQLEEKERRRVRSQTFIGLAQAMAKQWGNEEGLGKIWNITVPSLFA